MHSIHIDDKEFENALYTKDCIDVDLLIRTSGEIRVSNFLPWQLSKIARRASMGIGRLGGGNHTSSGDIFLAFSTANENAFTHTQSQVDYMGDDQIDPFYIAATQATEEAIMNALVSAETLAGRNCNTAYALPHDRVKEILCRYQNIVDLYTAQGEQENKES